MDGEAAHKDLTRGEQVVSAEHLHLPKHLELSLIAANLHAACALCVDYITQEWIDNQMDERTSGGFDVQVHVESIEELAFSRGASGQYERAPDQSADVGPPARGVRENDERGIALFHRVRDRDEEFAVRAGVPVGDAKGGIGQRSRQRG